MNVVAYVRLKRDSKANNKLYGVNRNMHEWGLKCSLLRQRNSIFLHNSIKVESNWGLLCARKGLWHISSLFSKSLLPFILKRLDYVLYSAKKQRRNALKVLDKKDTRACNHTTQTNGTSTR